MKAGALFILLLVGITGSSCATMTVASQPQPYESISQSQFYDDLAPYGRWVQLNHYGLVWQPWDLPYGWRPYSDGYWVYTDYGWTFESDVPYGWAVYHYGRWAFDSRFGWVWVPGYEWGPAWVAWRYGDGYVGWAPLAPEVVWSAHGGFGRGGVDIEIGIGGFAWCFVNELHFCNRHIRDYLEVPARNVTIIRRSRNVTHYHVVDNRIMNSSISREDAERFTRQRVERYRVSEARSRSEAGLSPKNDELRIYQPRVQPLPSRGDVRRSIPNGRVVNSSQSRVARETPEQTQQRHNEEAKQFNSQVENQRRRLDNVHQEQLNQPKAKEERQPIVRQQRTEVKTFNQNRSRETRVLDQRQKMENREVRQQPRQEKSQPERKGR
ncbi:DUF6600 domain-containing protein [Acetobacteroides hydrogenigenes]|uniref:YXWGXW repeat-containing protein n=1 Tax=Acetobacteroides hydrogenigenes TaxID=979970 RepID=A0A4R2ENR9_9BACT|nr:DUF6600 domain-containing protein [Acetobacteroides hydrogenigenes]TCN70493.1 hypothetical protein CLV25_1037 [Acetobacteroides hydrogenigenes]